MWVESGHFLLGVTVSLTIMQIIFCIAGLRRHEENWLPLISLCCRLSALLLSISFITLLYAFYASDFSVALIAQSSDALKPALFRIASLWASYSGSIFLWCLCLSFYSLGFLQLERSIDGRVQLWVFLLQSIILFLFLFLLVVFANPFLRLYPPAIQGADLNALLEDINLIIHPPLLYLGYSGLGLAFSVALSMLLTNRLDNASTLLIVKYSKLAWIFLGLGMITGSYWAYYELGWGGYWAFDPVENYALMPWLAALGAIHAFGASQTRQRLVWGIGFTLLGFCLALIGTFFARTDFVFSVHSFVSDNVHNIAILCLISAIILPALAVFCSSIKRLNQPHLKQNPIDMLMNIGWAISILALFLATIMPLLYNIILHGNVFIKNSYYYYSFVPIMLFIIMLMPFGNLYKYWSIQTSYIITMVSLLCIINYYMVEHSTFYAAARILLLCFFCFVIASEIYKICHKTNRRGFHFTDLASLFAHSGIALLLLGVCFSAMFSTKLHANLSLGSTKTLVTMDGSFDISYVERRFTKAPNYEASIYIFTIQKHNRPATVHMVLAQHRHYLSQNQAIVIVGLRTQGLSQWYIAPEGENEGALSLSLNYNYDILLIWLGALISLLGAVVGFFTNKRQHK